MTLADDNYERRSVDSFSSSSIIHGVYDHQPVVNLTRFVVSLFIEIRGKLNFKRFLSLMIFL